MAGCSTTRRGTPRPPGARCRSAATGRRLRPTGDVEGGRRESALFVVGWRGAVFDDGTAARRSRCSGLAVATAVLAGVLAGVTIATDRSTAQAIERIPPRRGRFEPCGSGSPGIRASGSTFSTRRRQRVRRDRARRPHPLVLFRESTVAGSSPGSRRSTVSARMSSCARVASRARARPLAARCSGSVVAAGCPTGPACASWRSGPRRSARRSCTATSCARRTPRPRTPSSRPRLGAPAGITGPSRGHSSSRRGGPRSRPRRRSHAPIGPTPGCGRSIPAGRGSGTSTPSCATPSARAPS